MTPKENRVQEHLKTLLYLATVQQAESSASRQRSSKMVRQELFVQRQVALRKQNDNDFAHTPVRQCLGINCDARDTIHA